MAYALGPISGCHINPAVSIAMWVNKRLSTADFGKYLLSQTIGGLLGALILFAILQLGGMPTTSLGQNFFGDFNWLGASLIEIILTWVFVLPIIMVTSPKKGNPGLAGLVIGLTLVLVHILGIQLTGTSVNPARSFGPAILVGGQALRELPVFIIAPLIGGVLAAVTGKKLLGSEEK
jgi:aquaporin Z